MNIKQDPSPNYTPASQSQAQYGQPRTFKEIAIHWWGDPATKPTLQGVVNVLKTSSRKASATYVVSDKQIVQLVSEENVSWATGSANPFTISIEVDPNTPGDTYKTLGELVADIRKRRGNMPLVPHKKYMNTQCPGTIDLARIDREAQAFSNPSNNTKLIDPHPGYMPTHEGMTVEHEGFIYRSYKKDGNLLWTKEEKIPEPNPGYKPTHAGMTVEKDGKIYKSYEKDGKFLWTVEDVKPPKEELKITEDTVIPQIENLTVKEIKTSMLNLSGKVKDYQIILNQIKKLVESI